MHKRFFCGILAFILMLSLIPAIALPSRAVDMKTSEACIAILKEMEGFAEFPYFDYAQYSVGYGTACEKDDYPDGITEEEADALLREYIANAELELNVFANKYEILFSQYQFDALMLFTYNCGSGWMYGESDMRRAVINNAYANDFIYAYTQWSNAGGQLHTGLINRRLREANMYLNGAYGARPDNYTYVLYDAMGGSGHSGIQGYDYTLSAPVKSTPSREGYVFLGWYTAPEGGEWIRNLTSAHALKTFYAHWQGQDADPAAGTPAAYRLSAQELAAFELYDAPGGAEKGTLKEDEEIAVEADYVTADGIKWGRLSTGMWVKLGDPLVGVAAPPVVEEGVKVTVTGDVVNVRTGPGTSYPKVAAVIQNGTVYLTRVVTVEGTLWGKCRAGWLCLEYTDYAGGLPVEEPGDDIAQIPGTPDVPERPKKEETVLATGTVVTNRLYIRSAAGSRGSPVGSYGHGERVKLLEMTEIARTPWGRTDKGWICLTYVKLDSEEQKQDPTEPVTEATEPPREQEQEKPTEPEEPIQVLTGVAASIISKYHLNIRAEAGKDQQILGTYHPGQNIRIHEMKTVDAVAWGRTDEGWVNMQYVHMADNWNDQESENGIVICAEGLQIRSGAGAGYAPVDTYQAGASILIYGQVVVSGQRWGRTDRGWVCMSHVLLDSDTPKKPEQAESPVAETTVPKAESAPEKPEPVSGTVLSDTLNIRRMPGDSGEILGSYRYSEEITVLETRQVNGTAWGRTDRGWVRLLYVQMEKTEKENAAFTVVVDTAELSIRTGPGSGNGIAGSYTRGETVTILEQIRVGLTTWGRTDKGWICMDYVK